MKKGKKPLSVSAWGLSFNGKTLHPLTSLTREDARARRMRYALSFKPSVVRVSVQITGKG